MPNSWDYLSEKDFNDMDEAELEAEIAREEAALRAAAESANASAPPAATTDHAATSSPGQATAASSEADVDVAGTSASSTPPLAQVLRRLDKLEKMEADNARLKEGKAEDRGGPAPAVPGAPHPPRRCPDDRAALATGNDLMRLDSRFRPAGSGSTTLDSALAASARRRADLASLSLTSADLQRQVELRKAHLAVKQRGVDICVMVDCTGSMGRCIAAVKQQALAIMSLAPTIHPDAITRLAFVGYRDFGAEAGDGQHVVHDFVDKDSFRQDLTCALHSTIYAVNANGGGNAEDVTGALKKVTELSWASSTRLLIHFGDAPCHSDRYHNGRPVNGPDRYPQGNPDGLVPEDLLKVLVTNRIDYHFACIRSDTDIMQGIFKDVYAASPGAAAFEAHAYTDQTNDFLPLVVNSVTSSMRRSYRTSSSSGASMASQGTRGVD
ncbi:hypothetical protein CHLNCDRAFT_139790 [Chlorella variabilis]|uniref:VWFA domain-containing protein n=1 Tax=Chlorella variabilis TaxID=554065 RepID=E1ZQZ5_CHLVA|nr:hypothetical protein CHLNCDRAFT_139790 [Chlorella variabilis]EFN51874.1 hypothetical protein CHLNCDRAFT_139790 [Chlorella variabilis]|eukprot:XP_005843976.1 hypothetical protein CHLNCDRAFT_139790 [Chlorella variabilis]